MANHLFNILQAAAVLASVATAQQSAWGQCGGMGWTGQTSCAAGSSCSTVNAWYYQCVPGATVTTTKATATTVPTTTTTNGAVSCASSSPSGGGTLKYLGTNIDGFEWGTDNQSGVQSLSVVLPPLTKYGGQDGPAQMRHFVSKGFNIFRLPVGWAYLTNSQTASGALNSANLAKYDELVNACVATGAYCIVEIHNYARFGGAIIGQGGPSNSVFAAIWASLAAHYKSNAKVFFGLMNEPHDVPSITTWATTCQAAVTAIRNAGYTNIILLPGNGWSSAATFISDGSAAALLGIKNPDGTTKNLIFEVHKYLDSDNSGSHAECVGNAIEQAFKPLAYWLRCNGRQAWLTETGGGNVSSCVTYFCQLMDFLTTNSDVFPAVVGWGAANMAIDYVTSMTPLADGSDQLLVQKCYIPYSP